MICVDPMMKRGRTGKSGVSCHLFADDGDTDALHEFAKRIGMKRTWFQPKSKLPHYDLLTFCLRDMAVRRGAKEVDRRYWVKIRQENRGTQNNETA